jgi:hypothetical protein
MTKPLPQPGLSSVVDDPRLGIVSPQAIESLGGLPADLERVRGVGTGPFEVRSRREDRLQMSRYRRWWGSPIGLGPALDRVVFPVIAMTTSACGRCATARSGSPRRSRPKTSSRLPATRCSALPWRMGTPRSAFSAPCAGSTAPRPAPSRCLALAAAWDAAVAGSRLSSAARCPRGSRVAGNESSSPEATR